MAKQDTTLDDIADAIAGLATHMDERFEQVEQRFGQHDKQLAGINQHFDRLEDRMTSQEIAQRETNQRLISIEGKLDSIENDIKELYGMVTELQRLYRDAGKVDSRLEKRIAHIEAYVELVAKKTGIPFRPET
jgi:archaellum component FlaC